MRVLIVESQKELKDRFEDIIRNNVQEVESQKELKDEMQGIMENTLKMRRIPKGIESRACRGVSTGCGSVVESQKELKARFIWEYRYRYIISVESQKELKEHKHASIIVVKFYS